MRGWCELHASSTTKNEMLTARCPASLPLKAQYTPPSLCCIPHSLCSLHHRTTTHHAAAERSTRAALARTEPSKVTAACVPRPKPNGADKPLATQAHARY